MQLEAPDVEEYLPASQGTHIADDFEVYNPASHIVQADEEKFEYFPASQSKHVAAEEAPKADENVPAAHCAQVAEDDAPKVTE